MIDIYATTQGRDLGARGRRHAADPRGHRERACRKGSSVVLRGQVKTMNSAFTGLLFGLLGAIVLIYLLIVVNFQSWSDPFVIITALPAALAGIVWILFVDADDALGAGADRRDHVHGRCHRQQRAGHQLRARALASAAIRVAAALEAGFIRFRPVLMTALAMIIGMAPMALGLGEGGEQNAPLGRAVIGGLVFATIATLLFVPVVFSLMHKTRPPQRRPSVGDPSCRVTSLPRPSICASSRLFGLFARQSRRAVVATGIVSRERSSARLRDWTERRRSRPSRWHHQAPGN